MIHTGYAAGAAAVYALSRAEEAIPHLPKRVKERVEELHGWMVDLKEVAKVHIFSDTNWFLLTEVVGNNLWQALLVRSLCGEREGLSAYEALRQDTLQIAAMTSMLFLGKMIFNRPNGASGERHG